MIVGKPSVVLGVVKLIMRKNSFYQRTTTLSMFHLPQELYFRDSFSRALSVRRSLLLLYHWWRITSFMASIIHLPRQNPDSYAWVFHHILLQLLDEVWCTETIRTTAMLYCTSHGIVISVTDLHLTSYFIHDVQRILSSRYDNRILMPRMNHHGAGHSSPIFRRFQLLHVI